ncbi:MAG: ABC transporter permease [Candidatus Kapaibacteriota bacterium]
MKFESKFWIIAKRDYFNIVKSKGFWIGTFLLPVVWLLMVTLPVLLQVYFWERTEVKVAVLDKTNSNIGEEIVKADSNVFSIDNSNERVLNAKLLNNELEAYLVVDLQSIKNNSVTVYTKGGGGIALIEKVENVVGKAYRKHLLAESGLDETLIRQIEKETKVETKKVTPEGIRTDYSSFYSFFSFFVGIALFLLIFTYGGLVMRGVVEEKSNRIVEILLSSTKPFDIMLGKVIGLGSVGLTQIFAWIVLLLAVSMISTQIITLFTQPEPIAESFANELTVNNQIPKQFEIPPIPAGFVLMFIIYFLLGYFLVASIFAGLGSTVDHEQDAQIIITPVNIIFILPVFLINIIVANPNSLLSTLLSLFPPFTPVLMIARLGSSTLPLWQPLLSIVLMLLFIFVILRISAKIYRVGILIYGKKPSFKEIYHWLRKA